MLSFLTRRDVSEGPMGIRLAVVALLLTGPAWPAVAEGLPRYDVSGHCGRVAVVAGKARSPEMREACERREQEAHAILTQTWPTLSPAAQGRCLWAAHAYDRTYATLHDCVRLELEAMERRRRWGS